MMTGVNSPDKEEEGGECIKLAIECLGSFFDQPNGDRRLARPSEIRDLLSLAGGSI